MHAKWLTLRVVGVIGVAIVVSLVVGVRVQRRSSAIDAFASAGEVRGASTLQDLLGRQIPVMDLGKADRTVVIFLSPDCFYCVDGVSLYLALGQLRERAPRALQLVVAGREPAASLRTFAARYGLSPDQVVSAQGTNIRMVPTIVVSNKAGVIERVWAGEQVGSRATAVLNYMRSATQSGVRP
jgi:hypothetical protein